jgi:hypothetical protein
MQVKESGILVLGLGAVDVALHMRIVNILNKYFSMLTVVVSSNKSVVVAAAAAVVVVVVVVVIVVLVVIVVAF